MTYAKSLNQKSVRLSSSVKRVIVVSGGQTAEHNLTTSNHIEAADWQVCLFSIHPRAFFLKNELPVHPDRKVLFHAFPVRIPVLPSDCLRPILLPQSKMAARECF